MIVPMKKISLILLDSEKKKALKILRRLGVLHIEISEGNGNRLEELRGQIARLENAMAMISDRWDKKIPAQEASVEAVLTLAEEIPALIEEREGLRAETLALENELRRLQTFGEIDPAELAWLAEKGWSVLLYEMPNAQYERLDIPMKTLVLRRAKTIVQFVGILTPPEKAPAELEPYSVRLPAMATADLQQTLDEANGRILSIEAALTAYSAYIESMQNAVDALTKEVEFEVYATGMSAEVFSQSAVGEVRLAYFTGYLPAKDLEKLQQTAKDHAWGLLAQDPTPDDNAPTQLQNNKFVSLIYPLTDFLGTVPGYFEYDISAWFLGFILVFFGIIFGDGGYGLLICAVVGALIGKAKLNKKPIAPAYWLILLMGGATVLWGVLTCTWFGLSPTLLPSWLQNISLPIISNVYADRLWQPFWTSGQIGLTTTQNLQIVCFSLALVQLSAAHIMGLVRHRKSLKCIGDLGAVLQLIGIFYVVLSLVVNGEVFSLGLSVGGVSMGMIVIAVIVIGFLLNFVFANYEGSIGRSVLVSLKGIVSVLLGVVNVFSDIVSYIRLWAVGLAGAAISATVNDLVDPLLGNFMMMVFAIVVLVFGHGLNMILNVLSVIVHGVRLNTLEFSTHLDMSWSGHKYQPFEE